MSNGITGGGFDLIGALKGAQDLYGGNPYDFGGAFKDGMAEAKARQEAEIKKQREAEARTQIGEALRTGDYGKASALAYQNGQDKAAEGYLNIGKHRAEVGEKGNTVLANIANELTDLPYEERKRVIAQVRPLLVAQGYDPATVDAFDPTDENLGALAGYGYSQEKRVDHANTAFSNDTGRMTENRQAEELAWKQRNMTLAPGTTVYDSQAGAVKHQTPQLVTVGEGQTALEYGSGKQPVMPITMGDAPSRMAKAFEGLGASPAFIAAALGNAHHESSWNPAGAGDGGTSHGYFQHRDPEKGRGRATTFQQKMGVHPSQATPEQTAQFVMWELTTPEGRQSAGISEGEANAILQEKDPARAAMLFQRYYEKPKDIDPARGATASGYFDTLYGTRGNAGNRQATVIAQGPPKTGNSGGARGNGGNDRNGKNNATARAFLKELDHLEREVMPALEKDGWSGFFGGRVPAGLDAESDVFERAIANVYQLGRKLLKTVGEGAISDYETKLAMAAYPSRTQTPEGRREAIRGLRAVVQEMLADPSYKGDAAASGRYQIGQTATGPNGQRMVYTADGWVPQ